VVQHQALAPSSVLAFVSTIHAALVVLRLHRGRLPGVLLLAVPSLAFAAMPWVLATTGGLAIGLAAHLAWFVACEKLAPTQDRASRKPLSGQRPSSAGPLASGRVADGFVQVPVLAVHDETSSIKTFRLARPAGFDFQAGQFLTVRVHADGRPLTRCYSVSSPPEASGYLEISVKRQGAVSSLLHSTLRPGSLFEIRRPAGPFVYPAADDRPLVLVAGGIGITPLLSMLRHAVCVQPTRRVTLLYSVRSHGELAFADELSLLPRRHPQARVVVTVSGDAAVDLYRHGRIDGALVRETVPDPAGSLFFVCGPLAMIDAVRALLEQEGVPPAQVHAEAFAAAVAGAAAPEATPAGAGARVTFSTSRPAVVSRYSVVRPAASTADGLELRWPRFCPPGTRCTGIENGGGGAIDAF